MFFILIMTIKDIMKTNRYRRLESQIDRQIDGKIYKQIDRQIN